MTTKHRLTRLEAATPAAADVWQRVDVRIVWTADDRIERGYTLDGQPVTLADLPPRPRRWRPDAPLKIVWDEP